MNNAELIVSMLEQAGIRWVFGIPSGPVLPLIEALRESSIEYVITSNETSAGFMASVVGSMTGTPGVCVSTVGPGATNLATGVGAAWLDRCPVLAITCNVPTPWLDRRIQMRIDHHALFRPLTKATAPLRDGQVAGPLAMALSLACAEPPGPVHLDLPEDVSRAPASEDIRHLVKPAVLDDISTEISEKLSAALARSRKPLLITGLTFTRSKVKEKLLEFVERQALPFISTTHAKGFLPENHPGWVGVLGRARRSDVLKFIAKADLIISVGYDPIEINYEEWVGKTPVFHISTEEADVNSEVDMLLNSACNMDLAINKISGLSQIPNDWTKQEWRNHQNQLDRALRPTCSRLAPHDVLDILREALPDDGILAYDVGAHTHQIASQWRTDFPGTCVVTNGWSSMGFGIPSALAAKLVHPDRAVIGVVGDGCFQMTVGELTVAQRLGLAVPIIVLNDGWYGLMKVKQEHQEYPYSGSYLGPPADSPPHYFGVPCRGAHNAEAFREAIEWGLGLDGPCVIEAFVDVEPYSSTVFD
jgi:acetolactate synthase-1/2/3 large subunit